MFHHCSVPFVLLALIGVFVIGGCKSTKPTAEGSSKRPVVVQNPNGSVLDDPQRVEEAYVEATTFMIRGDVQSAKERFLQVLELNPAHHASRYNLARMALDGRSFDEAILYGTEALAADRTNYWYYKVLARAYAGKGAYGEAIAVQSELVDRFPDRLGDAMQLADWQQRNQDYEGALATLDLAKQRFPYALRIQEAQYELNVRRQNWPEALTVAERLSKGAPEEIRYTQWQYDALVALGREAEAIEVLKAIQLSQPDNVYAQMTLTSYQVKVALRDKKLQEAIQVATPAFSNPDIDPTQKLQLLQEMIAVATPQDQAGIQGLRQLAQTLQNIHPNSGAGLSTMGQLYTLSGQIDSAMTLYRGALEANPQDLGLWESLLNMGWESMDLASLQRDAEEALSYYPTRDLFNYYFALGAVYTASWTEAQYGINQIMAKNSASPALLAEVNGLKALMTFLQEGEEAALMQLTKLSQTQPKADKLVLHVAYAYQQQKDWPQAAKAGDKALKLRPNVPMYLTTRARIYLGQGQAAKALPLIERAGQRSDAAAVLETWGDVLHALGQKAEATQKWKAAIAKGATINLQQKQSP